MPTLATKGELKDSLRRTWESLGVKLELVREALEECVAEVKEAIAAEPDADDDEEPT